MSNKNKQKFSIRKRLESFKYAFNGLCILFREEHNARIHLLIMLLVISASFVFDVSVNEWLIICLCIALVFGFEIINSAIENMCDFLSPRYDKQVGRIKDLAAAAVLVSAIISVICGMIIFLPKILLLF